MNRSFNLVPTHNFFTLTRLDIERPFAEWRQDDIDQGFVWMPGSISYSLVGNPLGISISVETCDSCDEDISSQATRIIRLPFDVLDGVDLGLTTIASPDRFSLPGGPYMVQFEYWGDGYVEDDAWARLRFRPGRTEPAVLRTDKYMKVPPMLRLDGKPV